MTKFLLGVIATIILVFLLREGCNCSSISRLKKDLAECRVKDTVKIKRDTVIIKEELPTWVYVPQPYKVLVPGKNTIDSFIRVLQVDSAAILSRFFSTNFYEDSLLTKYGKVNIKDTVSQNKITGRSVQTSFEIPLIKETVTVKDPPKAAFYYGLNLMGNKQDFINRAGVSLMYLNKKNLGWEAGAMYGKDKVFNFHAGIKIKLTKN